MRELGRCVPDTKICGAVIGARTIVLVEVYHEGTDDVTERVTAEKYRFLNPQRTLRLDRTNKYRLANGEQLLPRLIQLLTT